ncbi:pickpocket protein 28-like isoform X1 [Bombyx mandarina]|uniref:Pickpocket protein 28-like isoform X1 n=1 Tax=Bombyx mandarina TaxID=7092 RepID=A0A6J2K193_BOMMA|nr:pickpocket protein 28-like isoform X1 [Bombyx mandarina]
MQHNNVWQKQRKRPSNTRKINLETLMRRSFVKVLKEYVKESSIGGIKEICSPNIGWRERLLWIGVFVIMMSAMFYYLHHTWFEILTKPLVISMESSTYPISKINFPAVAFCNTNRISRKALKEFSQIMHRSMALNNETIEEVELFFLQYGRLLDYSYDDILRNHPFLDIITLKDFYSQNTSEVMQKLAPKCDEMLLRCGWGSEEVNCKTNFDVQLTVRGHCCIFNYIQEDSVDDLNSANKDVKRQSVPGALYGLRLVLDPMIDDYAYTVNNIRGFDVFLFSPGHFADFSGGKVIYRIVEPDRAEFIELSSIQQRAAAEVRKYPVRIRKCFFQDENGSSHRKTYTYNYCIINCRIKSIQSLCKCTPYFLPGKDRARTCTLEDLKCLNKYREKLLYLYPNDAQDLRGLETEVEDSLFCPNCLPDCEPIQHYAKSYKISINTIEEHFVPFRSDML